MTASDREQLGDKPLATDKSGFNASGSKYLRTMRCLVDGRADVYAVLDAFEVTCPARQHAIKKLLCSGLRGKGDVAQDLQEARDAIDRAIQMEKAISTKDEAFPGWEEHKPRHWIYRDVVRGPLVALSFETSERSRQRYDFDVQNYVVGAWNSWVKVQDGSNHLFWPEDTPIDEMKRIIEGMDIRILNRDTDELV